MSVSFPTVRRNKAKGGLPGKKPGRPDGKPFAWKPVILIICAIGLGSMLYLTHMLLTGSAHLKVVASVPGGELMATHSSGFVIARGGEVELLGPGGTVCPLQGECERVIPSGPWIVGVASLSMRLIRPDTGELQVETLPLAPGERPLPLFEGDMVVTYRPHPETKFGEPWYLRAVSAKGDDIWHTRVAYAPLFGTSHGSHLVMAAVDISGGGTPWVLCVSIHTGELLWQLPLGAGAWRHLAVSHDGKVRAVLDSCVYCLTSDGSEAWMYRPAGTIVSAVEDFAITVVSVSKEIGGAMASLFGHAQVTALSPDGAILWDKKSMDSLPRLYAWDGRLILLESAKVMCLQRDTGKVVFSAKTDGYPIACAKDVILVYKDKRFILVDPGTSESVR
jgi:outer membrane protein assembly factor BamB